MGITTRKPVKGLHWQACVKLKDFKDSYGFNEYEKI